MDVKILYISTERKNSFFYQEIQRGIDILQSEISSIHSKFIELYSISVAKNENTDDSVECSIIEKKYDWMKNENSLPKENDMADINNIEVEELNLHDYYKASEYLHKYADLYCKNGSTVVYVLWCVQDYLPCPSEVVEFYGSLKRFHWWHNASLNIVTNNFEAIEEWLSYLPLQVAGNCEEVINSISQNIWRGSLVFSVEEKSSLTSLAEVTLRSESKGFSLFNFCCGNKAGEKVYMLPTAEVFTEVNLGTIPWPFIQKDSLCYISPTPNLMEKDKQSAMKVLESLTHSDEIGTLFRIRYSHTPPTLQGLEAANTDTWKQMIAEGNFDQQFNLSFQGQHDTLVLLILSKDPVVEWVYCVALTDPTSYGEDIVKLVFQEELGKKVFSMENELKVRNLFRGTMQFSRLETYALANIFLHLPTTIRKQFLKKGNNADDIPEEEKLRIERYSSKAILDKFILPSHPVELHACNTVIHPEVSLTVESFPEYKALEEKEKKNKSAIARCTSGDFLCGLPPPVIPQKTKGMDITQILNYFADGKVILSNDKGTSLDTRILDRKWIKNVSWRDALHLKNHGIYYNNSEQQEKFELRCCRLKAQVLNETSSSCTIFQKNQESSRPNQNRPKPHHEDKISRKKAFGVLRNSSQRPFFDSDSCSSRSFSVPLRRSPRKMIRGDVKPLDLSSRRLMSRINSTVSSSAYPSRVSKPSDLTEVHKQKLRNVVLTVLETEGIIMKHELFKLCFKKLFTVCKPFALDVIGQGATTRNFEKIAKAHVKQVVHFEKRKNTKRKI